MLIGRFTAVEEERRELPWVGRMAAVYAVRHYTHMTGKPGQMTLPARPTLGVVLTELGPEAELLAGANDALSRPVRGASVWTGQATTDDLEVIVIIAGAQQRDELEGVLANLSAGASRILALTDPCPIPRREVGSIAGGHTIIQAGRGIDPAEVVLAVSRALQAPTENFTRRLATLQRSLTQALGAPEPLQALLGRLKSTSNANVALVDKLGATLNSTGPVPLSLMFEAISRAGADSQLLDIDGWKGVADKINDPDRPGEYTGWLIATSRRPDFPDQYAAAAVHLTAALVEVCHRMTFVARQQERAIKAAVLEEALALRRVPDDPDITGRMASLGVNFDDGVRVAMVRPVRSATRSRALPSLETIAEELSQALRDASIPHLLSRRERHLVVAVQCSPAMLRRTVVAVDGMPDLRIGVGRIATIVGEIAHSHSDARLALQTLLRRTGGPRLLAYEDLDFAMRLFSEVGVDRMNDWARDFLRPLLDRPTLLEGLRAYFRHSQNMNAAADALSIHHNSLRYRLAKVEEILSLSLREPAALSSLFLALTALEHDTSASTHSPIQPSGSKRPADVDAPHRLQIHENPSPSQLGVVLSPDRD